MAMTQPIPLKMRADIAKDKFMRYCIYKDDTAPNHDCYGRVEWEHAFMHTGRRLNEPWAIVPCCTSHNRGKGLVKEYNQYRALLRAQEMLPGGIEDLVRRYPRVDWKQKLKYLHGKYGKETLQPNGIRK